MFETEVKIEKKKRDKKEEGGRFDEEAKSENDTRGQGVFWGQRVVEFDEKNERPDGDRHERRFHEGLAVVEKKDGDEGVEEGGNSRGFWVEDLRC